MIKKIHKFSIIIPILNEGKNIEELAKQISKKLNKNIFEIIFVDDNSIDNTLKILKKIKKKNKSVRYFIRKSNPDLSLSCILGFEKAAYENIIVMDGDFQHDPKFLKKMIKIYKKKDLDVLVSARDFSKFPIPGLTFLRYCASKILIYTFFLLVGKKTLDPMSGFFVFKKKIFIKNKKKLFSKGYKILSDLIYSSNKDLKIHDLFINFNLRKNGKSKMNLKVLLNVILFIGYNFYRKLN